MSLDPTDYRPTPFWFLNHRLEQEEIARQISLMADAGVGGFFLHPRAGLKTPYLSVEWMEMIRFAVEEASRHGLCAWLYDEDPYPSGAVGGRVFFDHPEFAARGLCFHEFTPDGDGRVAESLGQGRLLEALAIRLNASGAVLETRDVSERIGVLRETYFKMLWPSSYYAQIIDREDFPHYRAETFCPHLQIELELPGADWRVVCTTAETVHTDEKYGFLPDNLNPACTDYFLRKTHERYAADALAAEFGRTIPGIFTDEPAAGPATPWTETLEETVRARHGVELAGNYHRLFRTCDDAAPAVRRAYWESVCHLFCENFFRPIHDWCSAHGIALCGHGIGEENPLGTSSNTYAIQTLYDIPGFDHITPNIPRGEFQSLHLGGKLVTSAALQQGKRRVLSECFGCNGFNFGLAGMTRVAHWLFSLGVNWLVPHGFFYSFDGERKFDAGKSFFFQDPGFSEFPDFAAYAARIGRALGEADSRNHVCLLLPVSVFRSLLPGEHDRATAVCNDLYACVNGLLARQVQFDIADEEALASSDIEAKTIRIGVQEYDTVVLPTLGGIETPEIARALAHIDKSVPVHQLPEEIDGLERLAGEVDLAPAPETLLALLKKSDTGPLLYLFNNSSEPLALGIGTPADSTWRGLDAWTGKESRLPASEGRSTLDLRPYGAALLKRVADAAELPVDPAPGQRELAPEEPPVWSYTPPGEGWLGSIERWQVRVGDPGEERDLGEQGFCLARDLLGTELPYMLEGQVRPIFDHAPLRESLYPMQLVFEAIFEVRAEDLAGGVELVLEESTLSRGARVLVNDTVLTPEAFVRRRIYDPNNWVATVGTHLVAGMNTIRIVWKEAGEFDGLRSAIHFRRG